MNRSRGLKQSQNRAWGQALLSQPPSLLPAELTSQQWLLCLSTVGFRKHLSEPLVENLFPKPKCRRWKYFWGGNDLDSCLIDCRVSEMDVVALLQMQALFSQLLHWLLHPGLWTQQSAVQFLNIHERTKKKRLLVELGVFSNRKCLWFLSLEVIPFLAPITTYPFV